MERGASEAYHLLAGTTVPRPPTTLLHRQPPPPRSTRAQSPLKTVAGLHGVQPAVVPASAVSRGSRAVTVVFDLTSQLLLDDVLQRPIESTQYTSGAYREELAAHGMIASMSGKGDCYDNAVAESFFATLEFELLMRNDWHTRHEARRAIFRYIETWYNRRRRHSTLGYISPAAYEAQLQEAA